jgi:hypothetical protein
MDSFKKKGGDISLYVAATAIFISILAVIFFYKEIKKIKMDTSQMKTIRNQVSNMDTRLDTIEGNMESIERISDFIHKLEKKPTNVTVVANVPVPTVPVKEPETPKTFLVENSDSEESDSDEEEEEAEEEEEEIKEVPKPKKK